LIKDIYPSSTKFNRSLNFQKLWKLISKNQENIYLNGLYGSSITFFLIDLFSNFKKPIFFITDNKEESSYIYTDIVEQLGENYCSLLPSSFNKFSTKSVNKDLVLSRTKILEKIYSNDPSVYISNCEGIIEKIPTKNGNTNYEILLSENDQLSLYELNEKLFELEYTKEDFVQSPGDFALRGNILDVFSYSNENPIRIQFDDNKIERIREFNIDTQYSINDIKKIKISPNINSELLDKNDSVINIINNDYIVVINSLELINEELKKLNPSNDLNYYNHKKFNEEIKKKLTLFINNKTEKLFYDFKIKPQPSFNKNFNLLNDSLTDFFKKGYKLNLFFSTFEQSERFKQILDKYEREYEYKSIIKPMYRGFINENEKKLYFSDHEIFNRYHKFKLSKRFSKSKRIKISELNKLEPGDYVTHIDHGVGIFKGLTKIEVNGAKQEAIKLNYGERDTVYLSVHLFHKISKYNSKDGTRPRIYKLGSGAWEKLKNKAKIKVKKLAFDLIKSYAKRKISEGFVYKKDSSIQNELEASFLYVETEDQIKANKDVKMDMESSYPMDRLICGDVGFGKTEIAIRAAFKAVDNGKQVVILVPTTILAFQHYKTFTKRFEDFPISFDYLNRFRSEKDKNKIISDINSGKLDIVIGTHQVVNDKIKYPKLGLLIVDEEQKFGVNVKEKIRSLKENIDVLTLTATPIPRTLQYSLMSARDLSIINTPPPNRVPIQSEVIRFDNNLIRDSIQFEIQRGGQVFFVHNRIDNINEFGIWLQELVPYAKIRVAHGRINGKKLEKIMLEFINNEFDILLSTTIIESGLDVSNANTIFINNAQNFGLSDLHQMRGRVGRSNKNAFCFFITPPISAINNDAKKRITAINQYSDLGSGFNISMKDLEIRGSGDILGGEQSGFINDIGFETYQKILSEAVNELKNTEFKRLFKDDQIDESTKEETIIDSDLEILFPTTYIPSSIERLNLYQKLSIIENNEELELFKNQLIDRFGYLPIETVNLLESVKLKWIGKELGFRKIVLKNKKMLCYFIKDHKNNFFKQKTFDRIMQNINKVNDCKIQQLEKNGLKNLYVVFEKIDSIDKALIYLNRL
jgi:transcription-repair coupling factor (superfamily II helicase)